MEFQRHRKKNGSLALKEWVSDCGQYKIAQYRAGFYAQVLTESFDGSTCWDFAEKREPHRTMKAAEQACATNKSLWDKCLSCTGVRQVQALEERYPVLFSSLPVWASKTGFELIECLKCQRARHVRTRTSRTSSRSDTGNSARQDSPASNAKGVVTTENQKTETPSNWVY